MPNSSALIKTTNLNKNNELSIEYSEREKHTPNNTILNARKTTRHLGWPETSNNIKLKAKNKRNSLKYFCVNCCLSLFVFEHFCSPVYIFSMEIESFCFYLFFTMYCLYCYDHHLRHFCRRMCVKRGLEPTSRRVRCIGIHYFIVWSTKLFISRNMKAQRRSHNMKISELVLL